MTWSIVDVARMSGVTSRRLRHYDEIGLLPAQIGSNGYRRYDEDDLLRLQQILVLRELGLGLTDIRAVLDEQTDQVDALRAHHKRLLAEQDRLSALAATVARTISELETTKGRDMPKINRPENLFEGFDQSQYDAEARERWPEEWEQSQRYVSTLTAEDTERMQREMTAAMVRMAELMVAGTPVEDPAAQSEIDAVHQGLCRSWTPDAEAFRGLGQLYVDDERYTAAYDAIAPGLAEYYRDAMSVYADTRLT